LTKFLKLTTKKKQNFPRLGGVTPHTHPHRDTPAQSIPNLLQNFFTVKYTEQRPVGKIHAADDSAFNSANDIIPNNFSNLVS
jgi:hypothetical protein